MRILLRATCLLLLGWQTTPVSAYRLLGDLNLQDGATWEVVAVSLYNYAIVPQQQSYRTFVVQDPEVISQMQTQWDFPLMFEDVCDYHYAIKVYRNKRLVKTLLLNLRCNYVTDGAFSYAFDPNLFEPLAQKRVNLPWSYIDYKSIHRIRLAMELLGSRSDVYFYHDTKPYTYDGYFLYGIDKLPLRTDRDSLAQAVVREVASVAGVAEDSLYVQLHFYSVEDDQTLFFRYTVYCNEPVGTRFTAQKPENVRIKWRTHFTFNPEIQLVVVGISERRYREIVGFVETE